MIDQFLDNSLDPIFTLLDCGSDGEPWSLEASLMWSLDRKHDIRKTYIFLIIVVVIYNKALLNKKLEKHMQ